ncbi:MAG: sugar phosphate isomerase/epimerase [Defluviitaleaceae bacterium]|nr:sugar phosphate isomerase/epimerase [Defluviitaleaceae bacterium]
MKVGVRAHDFGRQPVASLAANIREAGFECVQLAPTKAIEGIGSFADINLGHLDEALEAFSRQNLEITVLGCYIEPSVTDNEQRLKNVEIFRQNITNAKRLGIKIVGTETTNMDINTPTAEREKIYALLKDSVLRMVEQAEKENVFVGIEPVAEHTLNTPQLTRRLLDEVKSDKLKIIFDPVNLVLPSTLFEQDKIFNELFTLCGEEIVAVHIKDIEIEYNEKMWREIGKGAINYSLIMPWLHKNKPDISILREGVKPESYARDLTVMKGWVANV